MTTQKLLETVVGSEVLVSLVPHDHAHCVIGQRGEAIDLEVWNCEVYVDGSKEPEHIDEELPIGVCTFDSYTVEEARGCPRVTLRFSTKHDVGYSEDEKAVLDALQ